MNTDPVSHRRRQILRGLAAAALCPNFIAAKEAGTQPCNREILAAIKEMPSGGGYDTSSATTKIMGQATLAKRHGLALAPDLAKPSYCSGATYLVLLQCLDRLGLLKDPTLAKALIISDIADGTGAWGRWNANGPGAARFCYQTGIGANFEDWKKAAPGDFLKIFWNEHVGAKERGHLVVLTDIGRGKDPLVRFWSSNQPKGYGTKSVKQSEIKWAIFSRIQRAERIGQVLKLPKSDTYLAGLLKRPSNRKEVREKCGMPPISPGS